MAADSWAAVVPAVVFALTVFFAVRLTFSRTADPKFEFLNSLLEESEDKPKATRRHAA